MKNSSLRTLIIGCASQPPVQYDISAKIKLFPKIFKSLMITLLLFTAQASHADHPAMDPVVRKLRGDFSAARIPTERDLKFGNFWNCSEFFATYGRSSDRKSFSIPMYLFSKTDGIILNRSNRSNVTSYVLSDSDNAVIGSYVDPANNNHFISSIRVTSEGYLISEWATSSRVFPEGDAVRSAIHRGKVVVSYTVCDGVIP